MLIQVKSKLTLTTECKLFDIRSKYGDIVHTLNDGYSLIEFSKLVEKKRHTEYLQWYVHENDFHLAMNQTIK